MINLEDLIIQTPRNHSTVQIESFEVWFMTPFGLYSDIKVAIARVKQEGLSLIAVRPVCVAIGTDRIDYEVMT